MLCIESPVTVSSINARATILTFTVSNNEEKKTTNKKRHYQSKNRSTVKRFASFGFFCFDAHYERSKESEMCAFIFYLVFLMTLLSFLVRGGCSVVAFGYIFRFMRLSSCKTEYFMSPSVICSYEL